MELTRKAFLAGAAACAAAPAFAKNPDEIRSVLLHWGLNMWGESLPPDIKGPLAHGRLCNDKVKFSDKAWNLLVDDMVAKKMNMVQNMRIGLEREQGKEQLKKLDERYQTERWALRIITITLLIIVLAAGAVIIRQRKKLRNISDAT